MTKLAINLTALCIFATLGVCTLAMIALAELDMKFYPTKSGEIEA